MYKAITVSEVDCPYSNGSRVNWNESCRPRLQLACIHLLVAAEAIDYWASLCMGTHSLHER